VTEEGILAFGEDFKEITWRITNGANVSRMKIYKNIKEKR